MTRLDLLNGIAEPLPIAPVGIEDTPPERELQLIENEMLMWRDSYRTTEIRYDVAKALGDSETKTACRKEMERHRKAYDALLKRHATITTKIEESAS